MEQVAELAELDELIAWYIARESPRTYQQANAAADAIMDGRPGSDANATRLAGSPLPPGPFPVALLPGWYRGRKGDAAELAALLRRQVERRLIPPGAMLPTTPELAAKFGVSQRTMGRAIGWLRAEGLVERRPARRRDGGQRVYVTGLDNQRTQAA